MVLRIPTYYRGVAARPVFKSSNRIITGSLPCIIQAQIWFSISVHYMPSPNISTFRQPSACLGRLSSAGAQTLDSVGMAN